MESKNELRFILLLILLPVAIVTTLIILLSAMVFGDGFTFEWWGGFTQNFATEMLGALATYFIFDLVVRRREQTRERENLKERLIKQLASPNQSTAHDALIKLRDHRWGEGSDQSLFDKDFSGAALETAQLNGMRLKGVKLYGANLAKADLRQCNLQNADLRFADLRGADLRGADLSGAALAHAKLVGAQLQGAILTDTSLMGANLRDAVLDDDTDATNAIPPDSDLFVVRRLRQSDELDRYINHTREDFWEPTEQPLIS